MISPYKAAVFPALVVSPRITHTLLATIAVPFLITRWNCPTDWQTRALRVVTACIGLCPSSS